MSSFKKLNKADITVSPYHANKRWELTASSGTSGSTYFSIFAGQNADYSPSGPSTNNQSWALVYASMNHMFYQSYTDKLDTGSLMFNVNTLESASQQRPTASYFDYNNSPYIIKNYPTGANNVIRVISIDKKVYGNKILPHSFNMSSSGFIIRDDGYGNLFGSVDGTISGYFNLGYIAPAYFVSQSLPAGIYHVGNIFYAHGLAIITTGSFASSINVPLSAPLKLTFQNEHTVYENEVRCIVRESDFNLTYNPTLFVSGTQYIVPISGSNNGYTLTGSNIINIKDFATGSDFQPYVTSIGLYNDTNDLLMVAKLAKPIVLSSDTDMTFIVRYDT